MSIILIEKRFDNKLNIKKKLTEYSDIMHFNEIDIKGKSWADL